jgi:hypothetical protein
MRFLFPAIALAGLLLFPLPAKADGARILNVEPPTAKIGDMLSANGESIDKAHVDAVYLTNGKDDIKVELTEQSDTSIKFKVPPKTTPGRWAIMIHTKGGEPRYLEQPVKVTVE